MKNSCWYEKADDDLNKPKNKWEVLWQTCSPYWKNRNWIIYLLPRKIESLFKFLLGFVRRVYTFIVVYW